ncbi:aldo/keto reductase family oxidoreductase [Listeria sp. FSL L7-0233]|uniref:Aldo/keto reductase family oxidoreductase n=1 Tax=Listeria cossartiae subsp. cayugensis TaxID=2713505 RepID=A0A7X0ZAC3_9LIST|nr:MULTISPECIES: aldo/keto reductase family oxidoreductase [Listeria]MBC1543149.1 aldo/keto reductase family oxidoreductase [Listeria cossartiae subsp. cossartiae]MBC1550183.1 aldo/keto reductase family oxidoreductase [Listeria cossartiae subsp. cossartiae]MBC1567849.1 aldo/keto reductase family oxidoreductase [Listeria cossartiae subsp. cossartiae]MBC1571004.1 aldo/keto reductase family oxidoreductase [Listeria cossartiae subsp. cossartiae]MBC1806640.1 aldo/keto reductase family oxidoreductas
MKRITIGNSALTASEISLGCMRMADLSKEDANKVINTALENGIDFFDHADIYGGGKSEEVFADAIDMNATIREKMILQSKCGIRQGFFDFSKEHIISSVEGSLKRLKTDYLDTLLLHRPDTLFEPEEVAAAFTELEKSGKVRHFGVSNQNPGQIELLKKYVDQELIANQLQFSIMHTGMIDTGFNVNMTIDPSLDRDGGILEYSRLNNMTIQAWSPFQFGFFEGVFLDNDKFPELNKTIDKIAADKGVTNSAIAVAWIQRHPASFQTVVGTMNPGRIADIAKASDVTLSREEWYEIYRAAGNQLP